MAGTEVDWDFIQYEEEGKKGIATNGYCPYNPKGNDYSGVTIAVGFDLGQIPDEKTLKKDYNLPDHLVKRFKPYLGKKREEAASFLKKNPLRISQAEGELIFKNVQNYWNRMTAYYYHKKTGKKFENLPGNFKTVLVSNAYQHGANNDKLKKLYEATAAPTKNNKNVEDAIDEIFKRDNQNYRKRRENEKKLVRESSFYNYSNQKMNLNFNSILSKQIPNYFPTKKIKTENPLLSSNFSPFIPEEENYLESANKNAFNAFNFNENKFFQVPIIKDWDVEGKSYFQKKNNYDNNFRKYENNTHKFNMIEKKDISGKSDSHNSSSYNNDDSDNYHDYEAEKSEFQKDNYDSNIHKYEFNSYSHNSSNYNNDNDDDRKSDSKYSDNDNDDNIPHNFHLNNEHISENSASDYNNNMQRNDLSSLSRHDSFNGDFSYEGEGKNNDSIHNINNDYESDYQKDYYNEESLVNNYENDYKKDSSNEESFGNNNENDHFSDESYDN